MYEVDQSNKIECSGYTALVLTNDKDCTIRISGREKRAAIQAMHQRFERLSHKLIHIRLFTAALYYLIRELPPRALVIIDTEYTGHEANIKAMLLYWLRQDRPDISPDDITFGQVGKRSRAHKKALAIYRGKAKADRTLKADDLLRRIIGP